VVAPDLRGFGRSPVTPGLVLMREFAADIEELLDALAIARAAVVGLSMGGLVAMELAAASPERYWALGLVATTAQPPSPEDLRIREERAAAIERDGIGVLVDYMHRSDLSRSSSTTAGTCPTWKPKLSSTRHCSPS
jgi:3-oxoadipate enol-lactonase